MTVLIALAVAAVTRGPHSFAVFLGCLDGEPGRWYVGLEQRDARQPRLLDPGERRDAAQLILEAGAASLPGVAGLRWHMDHTTLQEA